VPGAVGIPLLFISLSKAVIRPKKSGFGLKFYVFQSLSARELDLIHILR